MLHMQVCIELSREHRAPERLKKTLKKNIYLCIEYSRVHRAPEKLHMCVCVFGCVWCVRVCVHMYVCVCVFASITYFTAFFVFAETLLQRRYDVSPAAHLNPPARLILLIILQIHMHLHDRVHYIFYIMFQFNYTYSRYFCTCMTVLLLNLHY
jgi:hypothetical protein